MGKKKKTQAECVCVSFQACLYRQSYISVKSFRALSLPGTPPPPVLLNPGEVSILVTKLLPGPSGLSVPSLLCFSWFRPIYRLQFNRNKSAVEPPTIFPQHAHIDGFHDPQLPSTLKPTKTRRTWTQTSDDRQLMLF